MYTSVEAFLMEYLFINGTHHVMRYS